MPSPRYVLRFTFYELCSSFLLPTRPPDQERVHDPLDNRPQPLPEQALHGRMSQAVEEARPPRPPPQRPAQLRAQDGLLVVAEGEIIADEGVLDVLRGKLAVA